MVLPIVVTKELILIDGYHRLIAHRLEERKEIEVKILDIPKERILWEASKLNSKHGFQLSRDEKWNLARKFYQNNGFKIQQIANTLNISVGTLDEWIKDLIKETKREQEKQIIDLYLKCLTYREIFERTNISIGKISDIVQKFQNEKIEQIAQNPGILLLS
jgi:ParB-like chromosome segregation protein Spo0J